MRFLFCSIVSLLRNISDNLAYHLQRAGCAGQGGLGQGPPYNRTSQGAGPCRQRSAAHADLALSQRVIFWTLRYRRLLPQDERRTIDALASLAAPRGGLTPARGRSKDMDRRPARDLPTAYETA